MRRPTATATAALPTRTTPPHNHISTSTSLPRAALSVSALAAPPIRPSPAACALCQASASRLPTPRYAPQSCAQSSALPCPARFVHHDALHTEDTVQHTASNVGTPQCPAFWPCQPRLSLSTPFPEEPSTTRPTDSFFCSASNPGTAHADLSFLRVSARALCSP
jgi:hypothetical protein